MDKKKDKANEPAKNEDRQRVPPLERWSNAIDDIIDQAVSEGLFDNLPGKGKPLKLSTNPFSADTELAHQLLKNNDYTLPWIAERGAVNEAVSVLRTQISQQWSRFQAEFLASNSETIRMSLNLNWARQIDRWSQEIQELNKRIAETNLKQPGSQLEILKLNLDSELAKTSAKRELD